MSESIIEIRPVQREAAKLVIGLAGVSGSGKTYTALQIAHGLAGEDPTKIGMLDTENRRGSLYAEIFDKPFQIGDLTPPFSPERYVSAMRQFSNSGIKALVVDSMSHEWEGEGGCEEIANDPTKRVPNWLKAKREHKRFMNALLLLPFHVVLCFRAREKTDFSDPSRPKSLGIQPICEKNVMYEMTLSYLLDNAGQTRIPIKPIPEPLIPIVGGDGYLTSKHGKQLLDWVGGANGVDVMEEAKSRLRYAASEGSEALKTCWLGLTKAEQKALASFKDTLKDSAAHADSQGSPKQEVDGDGNVVW